MNAAGHKKVARPFRRRAREHGRFHFEEAHLVHHLANFEDDLVAQREIMVRLRPTKVEIAEAQARLFRRVDFVFDREGRRLGVIQNVQFRRNELHFPAGQFRIGFLPLEDLALDGDHEFAACLLGFGMRRRRLFVEDYLDDTGAIAHVEKEQIAKVAAPRHPAHHNSFVSFVLRAELAAVVCALQISQKVQHCP